jgi:hypothetical protein
MRLLNVWRLSHRKSTQPFLKPSATSDLE